MVDDGTGSDITIPLIMIQEDDGEALRAYLKRDHDEQSIMKIDFEIEGHRPKANVKLFFSSNDHTIQDFLVQFKPYFNLISMNYCSL